ncbi:MAG: hypothetical protein ABFD76_00730 [Smithella sp.]
MSRAKAGDVLSCEVCGLSVIVDEECGCATIDLICCEEPMVNLGPAKTKKAHTVAAVPKKITTVKTVKKATPKKKPVAKKKSVKKTVAKKKSKKPAKKTAKKTAKKK